MGGDRATIEALARDRSSGAASIAERAARALAELPPGSLGAALDVLLRGQPSMAPMWRLATEVLSREGTAAGIQRFLALLESDAGAPRHLAAALPETILTISNSTMVAEAIRIRRPSRTLCMRSLPGGEGVGFARSLSGWTAATSVPDGRALLDVPAEAVVCGADAVTPEGVVNKVKTVALARAARERGVPVHAVAGESKLLSRRPPLSGPFEIVPLDLFTSVAMAEGLLSPDEAAVRAGEVLLAPELLPLFESLGGAAGP